MHSPSLKEAEEYTTSHDADTDSNAPMGSLELAAEQDCKLQKNTETIDYILVHLFSNTTVNSIFSRHQLPGFTYGNMEFKLI